jgi:Bacterial pre-peptidase C-terminal domain
MMKRILLIAILALVPATAARAASPSLGNIQPRGVQRGTDAVLSFSGSRLADAKEIFLYHPGVSVTKLEVVNDALIKATVKIAPDCRLGEHSARIRTAGGISELKTFWVGALPVIEEKEPNSEIATAQKVLLNVTIAGVVDNEDVDIYAFEAKKGQRVSAEIEGMRLANTFFDPHVSILDAKQFELAATDDSPLLGQDAACSIVIPADGTYYVQVRESAYGGNGACQYRLHLGNFPRPTAVIPAGGKPGEEIELTFLGDPTGPFKQKVKLPAVVPPGKFGVFAQDASGISPSPIPFRLSGLPNVIETDGNNSHATATKVAEFPAALNGVIAKDKEVDHYRFTAKKGQTYDVHCYARRLGSALDSVMYIYNLNGGALVGNDDAIGPDSYFRWTVPADGEYVLTVTDHLGKGGPNYFYRVEFNTVQPRLSVTIPKVDIFGYSQERQTITVPRGNRVATMVVANRSDVGGDLVLGGEGLPAGLRLDAETMPANLNAIPVVFEAGADAPVAGTLAQLTATLADPKTKLTGGFEQGVILVGVPNQGIYWKHEVDRAAIAVGEEVPFKIGIVEPKAPMVQNGSMNLKIVAERKAGFKGPITIYPLFNPPGVGSAGSVVIAEGQTEGLLPMNAAPNAQARKWKTTVIATADCGKGPVWVSSQLATIEIAPPFITFVMERSAGEQGKTTDLFCKVTQNAPFTGTAKVVLVGLPPKVTAPEATITKDAKEVAFKLTIDPTSPPGQHNNVFCQVYVTHNGETVLHNVGGTQLRIDVPLPPKPNEAPKPMVTAPPPMPKPTDPPVKRLTRLEQLRKEQEEREKAQQAGDKPPEKK